MLSSVFSLTSHIMIRSKACKDCLKEKVKLKITLPKELSAFVLASMDGP
jgi:hypothetical protein